MSPRSINDSLGWRRLGFFALLLTVVSWAMPGLAQISVRSATQNGVASSVNLVIPKPPGTSTGDVLVAVISIVPGNRTVSTPTGWISRSQPASTAAIPRLALFTRLATAADGAVTTYTFAFTGGAHSGFAGGIVAFIGVNHASAATLFDGTPSSPATPAGHAHTAPSITTTASGAILLTAFSMPGSTTGWTPPAGMLERVDVTSVPPPATGGVSLAMSSELRPAAGATGTRTATAAGPPPTAAAGRTMTVGLRQPPLSRFRIRHDGSAHSCTAESITIFACAVADCSTLFTFGANGTLVAGGNSVPFNIPAGQTSTTVALLLPTTTGPPDPESVRLAIASPAPVPALAASCQNLAGGPINTDTACDVLVTDANFVVEVPDHIADTQTTINIRPSTACTSLFANVTRSVGFWATYADPASGTLAVTLDGIPIVNATPGTPLSLSFNASGIATPALRYADAGALRLHARYSGSSATGDAGLVVTGDDRFVARPARFQLTIANHVAGPPSDATRSVFEVAGVPFALTAQALNASGLPTPNFGREATPEGVGFESVLQAPLGGLNPPPITAGFTAWVNGAASGTVRFDEVGVITLRPRLASAPYLDFAPSADGDVVGTEVANVGRFRPARLAVAPNVPQLQNACVAGGFGYMGQEFGFGTNPQLTVTGRNALDATTGNYVNAGGAANAFWRFGGTLANRGYVNTHMATLATLSRTTDGGNASVAEQTGPPFDGSGTVTIGGDRFTWAKPALPEDPFTPQFSLALSAADLTDSDGVCFDTTALDGCDPLPITGITGPAGSQQRWGRIALSNAFGPELLDLQLPMRAEFFNGTAFVANTEDVCSGVTIQPIADVNPADSLLPAETCVQDSGSPGASGQGCAAAGPVARRYTLLPPIGGGGSFVFWLRAPGAGNAGILDVTANVPAWLQFNWRGTGLLDPTARVGFGVFQGDRRAIFRREVY